MLKLIIIFSVFLQLNDCAKILGIFGHAAASHTFLGKVLLKNLALRGHNVTMIGSFPLETKLDNYHDIELPELLEDMKQREMMYFQKTRGFEGLKNMTVYHTELLLRNSKIQNLLRSNDNFDLIVIDYFFNEAIWIFSHIYKAPIILMSSSGNLFILNHLTGNTLPYSYVPTPSLPCSDDIPFHYRIISVLYNWSYYLVIKDLWQTQHEILKKYFNNPPTIDELSENIALVLSNSHFSTETPRPYTPNIIPVGGFHIQKPEPLPKDLKTFLDSATDGVIFFSLGSQIKTSNLKPETIKHILKAFSRVKQMVLLKYETTDTPEIPSNVKILKWIPQSGVLSHPNVKLFITHGGLLSMIESIHFGVPMICIPVNSDQPTNAEFIESRHLGRTILLNNLNEDNFYQILNDLIMNGKYKENAGYFSNLLRNQSIPPLDNAIYWVEHVIKHRGAPHLKPFSIKLPWYKYFMIDVIVVGIVGFWIMFKILKTIIVATIRRIFRSFKTKTE